MPLTMNDREPVLEFACHEGNYAVPNILSAARAGEREQESILKRECRPPGLPDTVRPERRCTTDSSLTAGFNSHARSPRLSPDHGPSSEGGHDVTTSSN